MRGLGAVAAVLLLFGAGGAVVAEGAGVLPFPRVGDVYTYTVEESAAGPFVYWVSYDETVTVVSVGAATDAFGLVHPAMHVRVDGHGLSFSGDEFVGTFPTVVEYAVALEGGRILRSTQSSEHVSGGTTLFVLAKEDAVSNSWTSLAGFPVTRELSQGRSLEAGAVHSLARATTYGFTVARTSTVVGPDPQPGWPDAVRLQPAVSSPSTTSGTWLDPATAYPVRTHAATPSLSFSRTLESASTGAGPVVVRDDGAVVAFGPRPGTYGPSTVDGPPGAWPPEFPLGDAVAAVRATPWSTARADAALVAADWRDARWRLTLADGLVDATFEIRRTAAGDVATLFLVQDASGGARVAPGAPTLDLAEAVAAAAQETGGPVTSITLSAADEASWRLIVESAYDGDVVWLEGERWDRTASIALSNGAITSVNRYAADRELR